MAQHIAPDTRELAEYATLFHPTALNKLRR
jgi:hypothetical protein